MFGYLFSVLARAATCGVHRCGLYTPVVLGFHRVRFVVGGTTCASLDNHRRCDGHLDVLHLGLRVHRLLGWLARLGKSRSGRSRIGRSRLGRSRLDRCPQLEAKRERGRMRRRMTRLYIQTLAFRYSISTSRHGFLYVVLNSIHSYTFSGSGLTSVNLSLYTFEEVEECMV